MCLCGHIPKPAHRGIGAMVSQIGVLTINQMFGIRGHRQYRAVTWILSTKLESGQKERVSVAKKVSLERRHFELIAQIIAEIPDNSLRCTVCLRFAGALQATNEQFDWDRFVLACKLTQMEVDIAKEVEGIER